MSDGASENLYYPSLTKLTNNQNTQFQLTTEKITATSVVKAIIITPQN